MDTLPIKAFSLTLAMHVKLNFSSQLSQDRLTIPRITSLTMTLMSKNCFLTPISTHSTAKIMEFLTLADLVERLRRKWQPNLHQMMLLTCMMLVQMRKLLHF